MKKIPLKKYKWHKGSSRGVGNPLSFEQKSYKGVALTRKEQVAIEKINEIVDWINDHEN